MKPSVVGIAGGSGSGKTTYASRVAEALGPDRCVVLSHDSYYRPLPERFRKEPHAWNFDEPEALETALLVAHIEKLAHGHAVDVPRYDFARHDRVGHDRVDPRPIILVEGILVLADAPLRARMDHRVFVHAPEAVRLGRRIRRDTVHRGRTMEDVLDQYFRTVRPSHEAWVEPGRDHATLLIDGTGPIGVGVDSLLAILDDR